MKAGCVGRWPPAPGDHGLRREEPTMTFDSRLATFSPGIEAPGHSSPTDHRYGYLANSLVRLLETARRELEPDRDAAKASLATASSILRAEVERRSGANGSGPGGLAGWQMARVRDFVEKNLHRTIHTRDLSAVARRSTAHFSRSFKQ